MTEDKSSSGFLPEVVKTAIPAEVNDLFAKGMLAYKYRDFENCAEIFQNLVSLNPEITESHVNLGNAHFKLGRMDEAIACWKKALTIDSMHISCYVNLGNAYYSNGNTEEALVHWFAAVMSAPDHTVALMNIGSAYEKLGDLTEAFKFYELFLKFSTNHTSIEYKRVKAKVDYQKKKLLYIT